MTTDQDIQKIIIDQKNLRTVSLGFSLPVGSAIEESPGLTSVLVSHLQRQTANRNEDEFAEYIDKHGITTFSDSGRGRFSLGVRSPPQHVDKAFNLLKEMILEPEFDQQIIQKIVQQKGAQIQQLKSQPEPILTNFTSWRAAFNNDPITKHPLGDFDSLQQINVDDLENWHKKLNDYKLYFAGVGVDLEESDLAGLDDFLSYFSSETQQKRLCSDPSRNLAVETDVPPMPSANAYIAVNLRLPDPHDLQMEENIYNSILSGGMSARMFTEIRENRNLSYAPRSSLSRFRGGAKLSSMMDVRKERAEEALKATIDMMYDALSNPIPADEMKRALKSAQRIAVFVADSSQGYTNFVLSRISSGLEYDLDKIKSQLEQTAKDKWQDRLLEEWNEKHLSFAATGDVGDVNEKFTEYAMEVL